MYYTTHTDKYLTHAYIRTYMQECTHAYPPPPQSPHTNTCTHIPSTPLDVPKHLSMSQYLPVVDVEHVPSGGDHDVVIVAVPNAQHIGGHTVASTGGSEGLNSLGDRRGGRVWWEW